MVDVALLEINMLKGRGSWSREDKGKDRRGEGREAAYVR